MVIAYAFDNDYNLFIKERLYLILVKFVQSIRTF